MSSDDKYVSIYDDITDDAVNAIKLLKNGNFIESLVTIGYTIATLSKVDIQETDYNATDCINTSKAIISLFAPTFIHKETLYSDSTNHNWSQILSLLDRCNFISVTVHQLDYHRFILVKLECNKWYLIDSFSGYYTMKIRAIDPYILLRDINIMYGKLFAPPEGVNCIARLQLNFGCYDNYYRNRLLTWLEARVNTVLS